MPAKIEAGLRLRQLTGAVRAHGAATVQVGIDQRRQHRRALERRIKADPELAQEGQIRPEAGRHDQLIDLDVMTATI